MPTHLPDKPRAKVMRGHARKVLDENDATKIRRASLSRRHVTHKPDVIDTIDWLALFVLVLSASALFAAALVYFNEDDVPGAAAILAGAAGIDALALLTTKAPGKRD